MMKDLQEDLSQTKPFRSLEAEAVVSILRTAALLEGEIADVLKPHGLTATQYNVLRILRGAERDGLCRFEVGDRLITPGPDVTRLLDRLEDVGLVRRARDPEDRRHVKTWITPRGLELLAELDDILDDLHRRQVEEQSDDQLQNLVDTLAAIRKR